MVEQWLKKEYPKIKALAQREKAEIFFGDAAHMRSDHHAGRSWGKKGETPVVEARDMYEPYLGDHLARPDAVHDQGEGRCQCRCLH